MRYSFRLAELIGHEPNPRKRPGTIKAIVERTGLDRHQVAALLKNEVKYIPLAALSRLCDFLIEEGYVAADQLPGALFAVQPEHFWELLARRRRLQLCVGVRRPDTEDSLDGAWIVASDAVLMGSLLNGVTTLGGTARHQAATFKSSEANGRTDLQAPVPVPHPENLQQSLVWSPGQMTADVVVPQASEVYRKFVESGKDKALVCLGSTKSNPVVELILAEAFGCNPFESQDKVATPAQRACPFFIRYRDNDPRPVSCCGGMELAADTPTKTPGIYFETADGVWDCCPWDPQKNKDAAFVFFVHRESLGRLEMALGGFSGRATRLLAKLLASRADEFWPFVYEGQGIQIGAFFVKFELPPGAATDHDLETDLAAGTQIIKLDAEVIARRLKASPLEAEAAQILSETR
jgi:hypothetical protein